MRGFVPNPRFQKEMQESLAFKAAMRVTADEVKRHADQFGRQAQVPWLPRKGTSETFAVAQRGDETAVVNQDHLGHLQEWGSVNNPPHALLRRAARAAGLELK